MTESRTFEVYLHRCTVNGKGYVGMTCRGVRYRLHSHESEARRGSDFPFHRALRKYGINAFETSILATGLTLEEAKCEERRFIAKLGTFGPGGYNATFGGDGTQGLRHSKQRRRAISKMFSELPRTEQHRQRISNALKGRPRSPEHAEKIASKLRGRRLDLIGRAQLTAARAKSNDVWRGQMQSAEAKRKMRDKKARLLVIYRADGISTLVRTTYRALAESSGISHASIAASVKRRRPISKAGPLQGCRIVPFTETAMTMEEYTVALADPSGPFA